MAAREPPLDKTIVPNAGRTTLVAVVFLAAFIGLLAVLAYAQAGRVHNEAEELAGERPYCIQVPVGDPEYRPVKQWVDLTIFVAKGSGPLHHAVLVVGPLQQADVFHWSYKSQRFLQGTAGAQPIYCELRTKYLGTLGLTSAAADTRLDFYMAGHNFSIPRAYGPKPLWAQRSGLVFQATAPRFEPAGHHRLPDVLASRIEVIFGLRRLETHLHVADAYHAVTPAPDVHGLKRQFSRSALASEAGVQYFVRSAEDRVIILIHCFVRTDSDCSHSFEHDGWTYAFRHSHSDIENWQSIQQRLIDLTRSFSKSG